MRPTSNLLMLASLATTSCLATGAPGASTTGGLCGGESDSCVFSTDCCGGLSCVVNHCTPILSGGGGNSGGASSATGTFGSASGSASGSTTTGGGSSGGFGTPSQGTTTGNASATLGSSTTGGGGGELCLSPTLLDFGEVQVGAAPASLVVSASNCGQGSLVLAAEPITGPNAADFGDVISDSGWTLNPGATLQVTVTYSPQATGPSSATLPYLANGVPGTVELTGTGVDADLTFAPSPIVFQNVADGATAQQVVTATNTGTESLTVESVEPSGSAAFSAPDLPTLPLTLAPLQQVSVTVDYTPSGAAAGDSGQFTVYWTAASSHGERTVTVSLQGD